MTRTFTSIAWEPPTRSSVCSCRTRRSVAWAGRGSSPISSRKTVPPFASSKRPTRFCNAPVNDPFSCPKSSLSTSPAGSAAQFTVTSSASLRGLSRWISRAMSSLPVPVSPGDQHGRVRDRNLAEIAHEHAHRGRGPDDVGSRLVRLQCFLQRELLRFEP